MKILAFSDWRIQSIELLEDIIATQKPNVILYAGDDIHRFVRFEMPLLLKTPNHFFKIGSLSDLEHIISNQNKFLVKKLFKKFIQEIDLQNNNILCKLGIPFHYVNGNDDILECMNNIYYKRICTPPFFINGKHYFITETSKRKVLIKESKFSPFDIPRRDDCADIYASIKPSPSFGNFTIQNKDKKITIYGCECTSGMKNEIKNEPYQYADIYLSHLPPLGSLDLSVRFGIKHVGSKSLLKAIKKYHPKLVICGHSHIWGGFSKKIGNTLIINVSSQDRKNSPGNYALIDTDTWSVNVKTIQPDSTLFSIRGQGTITMKLKRKLNDTTYNPKGTHMSYKKISRIYKQWEQRSPKTLFKTLEEIETLGIDTKKFKERYESLHGKPKVIAGITIDPDSMVFVDVETGLANGGVPGKLWLIGLWRKNNFRQFLFPKEKKRFLQYIKQNQITSLASWTQYDHKALRPVLRKLHKNIKFIDVCQRTANCVIWHSYGLHELYKEFFPENNKIYLIPGHIAGLYADHLIIPRKSCPYCPPMKSVIKQIKERNKIDLLQMINICRLLWGNNKVKNLTKTANSTH